MEANNSKNHAHKQSTTTKSYNKIQQKLVSPNSTPGCQHSSLLNKNKQRIEDSPIFSSLFNLIKLFARDPKSKEAAVMQFVYHIWNEKQLDSLLDLFTSLKESKDKNPKIKIKYEDNNVIFVAHEKSLKVKFDKNALHHIFSYCNGPIDTVAKINYHNRNAGPVDAPDEIKYLSDSPGPIDAIMELLYHTRNEGQVDTVFEWYRLVRNPGDISSRDEIAYHNQNLGPQDTKGETLRRSKNVGAVDTEDERRFYGLNKQAPNNSPYNSGPIDTLAETKARGKDETLPPFNPTPKPYGN